ncbi:Cocaine esterase [Linnemannia hyalina]|uniref:Cocaine esterase n=1 Tax=Linnemannia hyalina TaxID=64524 RepID=A0A9P7XJR4_9FUNG|nr:Cocaine esterase [Linnemannia hyalina]
MGIGETFDIILPNYGTIRGTIDTKVNVAIFRNVPYAHVPERWRVSVKPQPWTGIHDATVQGPVCPQGLTTYPLGKIVPEKYLQVGTNPKYEFGVDQSERDSLNMNIYVPLSVLEDDGLGPVPVMVWVHGGALRNGANCVPIYDARNFVARSAELDQPVIVVAPNYRLAVFGFLASKELQQDMDEHVRQSPTPVPDYDQSVGNWGLQDQRLAFEWVRENIAALGGNGQNVTAWGESAGSFSIHYHMLIPAHYGLFDHAILQSGVVGTMPPQTVEVEGQAVFDKLLKVFNIPDDLDGLEKVKRLRAVSMDDLTNAANTAFATMTYGCYQDGGKLIPSTIPTPILSTTPSSYDPSIKSIMIGSTRDEGTAFALAFGEAKVSNYPAIVQQFVPFPDLVPLFQSAYGIPQTDSEFRILLDESIGDMVFQHPIELVATTLLDLQKLRGGPQHFQLLRYHYNVALNRIQELLPGLNAMHAGELPIIFGPPFSDLVLTESELRLSREIQKHWIAFANQKPITVDESGQVADVQNGEALIWTEDHRVEVGKGRKMSPEVQAFWDAMTKAKLQRVQRALDRPEQ